ncbi:hypothetical protein ONZ45_g9110 [Pleurotus djamor]|nr:hypothetical protein ONZ45_g9110 [Pleurotus djamor]
MASKTFNHEVDLHCIKISAFLGYSDVVYPLRKSCPIQTTFFCKTTFYFAAISFAAGYFLTELAMSIWVWSLWNRDKKVGVAILSLFAAAWMVIPIFHTRFVSSAEVTRPTLMPLSGCFLRMDGSQVIPTFSILLAFNLTTLMRVISIQVENLHVVGLSRIACTNCLFYYVCLLASSAVNLVVAVALPRELVNVLTPYVTYSSSSNIVSQPNDQS